MNDTNTIRVVVYKDAGGWVAQCLELDIGVQAETLDSLQSRFAVALAAEMQECTDRGVDPTSAIGSAPERFHRMWEKQAGEYAPRNPAHLSDGSMTPKFGLVA